MIRQVNADDLWNLSYAITEILSSGEPPQQSVEAVIRLVGVRLGFDCGTFWVVDEGRVVVRCISFWTASRALFPHFEVICRAREFTAGEGLPGAVWVTREPRWLDDLPSGKNFPRASVAEMDGIRSGVAFPARSGKRVSGVFEFFSRDREEAQPELLRFFASLGGQIGVFLSHYRLVENITEAEAEMRLAADASTDAVVTINEDSDVLFANRAVWDVFGWRPEELIGQKLMVVMPDYLRHVHEQGLRRYVETGQRHLAWDRILLPGLHKNGEEIPLQLAFGEFWRGGARVFTGFARRHPSDAEPSEGEPRRAARGQ